MTIKEVLANYKKELNKYWDDEKYKWVAVQHFQDHWNIEAEDFAGMLKESLSQTYNLLQGGMYYANKMICELAQLNPEKMRSLFRLLYNERLPLVDRLQPFRTGCDELLEEFRQGAAEPEKAKNHYQDLRALCVYLSFRYPETYFLFKYRIYTGFRKLVGFQETSQEKDSEIRKYETVIVFSVAVPGSAAEGSYTDVSETDWYYDAVQYMTSSGLMNGTGGGTFTPQGELTRAMLATVFYRMAGEPAVTGEDAFEDTAAGTWYSDAVLWASREKLVEGYGNGRFGPNDPVTQEQLVTILWRYAGEPTAKESAADASPWAAGAVAWARESKAVDESVGYTFTPRENASRAQIAAILSGCRPSEQRQLLQADRGGMAGRIGILSRQRKRLCGESFTQPL